MGDIVIIGGGFGGLEAARILSGNKRKLNGRRILLVDSKKTFDFLPMLPEVAGTRIRKESAFLDLAEHLEKRGVNFEQDEAIKVDPEKKEVFLKSGGVLNYEFLVVSCGSMTNFYGQDDVQRRALKLDSVDDAMVLASTVTTYPAKKILIIGGGYTGVEVASSLACYLRRKKIKKYSVTIVERGGDILGPLPEWMKDYCYSNLCSLRINIFTECSLKEITDTCAKLSNGLEFADYLIVWTAGVITPAFLRDLKFEKDRQGRLNVDAAMMFDDRCFAVGDAACFKYKGAPIRMSVQFSIAQASVAAKNILRLIAGQKKLIKYRPLDLGFLVPMANRKACGKVLFFRVWGFLGWSFHYAMCIYRSLGQHNRWGVFRDAFLKI